MIKKMYFNNPDKTDIYFIGYLNKENIKELKVFYKNNKFHNDFKTNKITNNVLLYLLQSYKYINSIYIKSIY